MSLNRYLKAFARVAPFSAILLFSVFLTPFIRASHTSVEMKTLITESEASSNCVTTCTPQSTVQFNEIQRKQVEEDEEPSPEPAEPDYLAFRGSGWLAGTAARAAYLLKYLQWRPPDVFSLYSFYRI